MNRRRFLGLIGSAFGAAALAPVDTLMRTGELSEADVLARMGVATGKTTVLSAYPPGDLRQEFDQALIDELLEHARLLQEVGRVSVEIHRQAVRDPANWIIVPPEWAAKITASASNVISTPVPELGSVLLSLT